MFYKLSKLAILAIFSILSIACSGPMPIYQVGHVDYPTDPGVSYAAISKRIILAGKNSGWNMELVNTGIIVGTRLRKKQMAKVKIEYDLKAYRISYLDSNEFNYSGNTILPKYNSWVTELEVSINNQIGK